MKNVLTPFSDNGHLTQDETNYNNRLSSIRAIIERAFARLKGKFRRLKYLDIADPNFRVDIITAACVLHNFMIMIMITKNLKLRKNQKKMKMVMKKG
jgi:hypothetical protein